jgi:hypothetical protein
MWRPLYVVANCFAESACSDFSKFAVMNVASIVELYSVAAAEHARSAVIITMCGQSVSYDFSLACLSRNFPVFRRVSANTHGSCKVVIFCFVFRDVMPEDASTNSQISFGQLS